MTEVARPKLLVDAVAVGARPRKLVRLRRLDQRQPVAARIHRRSLLGGLRDRGRHLQVCTRPGCNRRRVDQPVAPHPERVGRLLFGGNSARRNVPTSCTESALRPDKAATSTVLREPGRSSRAALAVSPLLVNRRPQICGRRCAVDLSGLRPESRRRRLVYPRSRTPRAMPMSEQAPAIASDPEIMSGTPVFVGTRVPFQTLLDYLEAGQPLSEFLEDFPTVSRERAITALEQAKNALLTRACPA